MSTSKTQVSALQLQRELELGSYRTAWFMCHRIRFAMADTEVALGNALKLDGTVEVDESFMGGAAKFAHKRNGIPPKSVLVGIVQRDGEVRTEFIPEVNKENLKGVLDKHVSRAAVLNTDESQNYVTHGKEFAAHDSVNHFRKGEYSRVDRETGRRASTNAVEGFFSNVKRSIDGTHHHVDHKHLPAYVDELTFKYNTRDYSDGARTAMAVEKVDGKRLSLRPMKSKSAAQQSSELVAGKADD